jgi:hypothetical protein
VAGARVRGRTDRWVRGADFDDALVYVACVLVVQVTVVQVVEMVAVTDRGVTTGRAVRVFMIGMGAMGGRHLCLADAQHHFMI